MIGVEGGVSVEPPLKFCLDDLTSNEGRTLERDLAQAVRIQNALLPTANFTAAGWRICYHYAPAGLVGGDCCDVFDYNDGLLFIVGDVSGKGFAASILMSLLHGTFRSLADANRPFRSLLEAANRIFSRSTELGQFATLVAGRATRDGAIEFVNAGHLPLLHLCEAGVRPKTATAVPLGLFSNAQFSVHRFTLEPGDALLVYTDGLTERCNSSDEEYGVQRVIDIAARHHAAEPSRLIHECLSDLLEFTVGTEQADDLTLLVIRRSAQQTANHG
jgi:sigma-B regulation protein RsbU (phosphoserine phosphatase)